ncbi:hypothetical protein [Massilia eburnea]
MLEPLAVMICPSRLSISRALKFAEPFEEIAPLLRREGTLLVKIQFTLCG